MPKESMRYRTTKEEREQMVIDRGNPKGTKSKMSEYLSKDNVKAFNRIVVSRNFDKLEERHKNKSQQIFPNYEECRDEVEGYFKLCDKYDIIPTIASLSLYLGTNRDTIYQYANNPKMYECSDILRSAIATCQGYHENAFMSGEVPPVAFIFYAKNYYGMKDTTDISVSANQQDNTINSNTMQTIKEQIELEKTEQKQLEYLKENE
ncbi:MAG: hypothetical protein IJO32_07975 [Bacilli bacterium]|nr:hypothetical protein [Bacilli bacterium]